jgi:hypothetical protein
MQMKDVCLHNGRQASIQAFTQSLLGIPGVFELLPGKGAAHAVEELSLDICGSDMDHSAGFYGSGVQIPDPETGPDAETHGLTQGDTVEVDHVAQGSARTVAPGVVLYRQEYPIHGQNITSTSPQ